MLMFTAALVSMLIFFVLSLVEWQRRRIIPLPKISMIGLLVASLAMFSIDRWAGLLGLIFSFLFFLFNLQKIPPDPPHKAVLLLFGKRVPVVIDEGWHLALKPFSLYSFLPVKVEKINTDFEFDEIRTRAREDGGEIRAGGRLSVQVSVTYQPDYTSGEGLIQYLNAGGEKGVDTILHDLIEEDLRQAGARYDWESFSFSQEEFTRILLEKLTGEEFNQRIPRRMRGEGLLVADLGVRIFRFTVGKIMERGALREAADNYEKERQERRGEELEMRFVLERVKELISQGLSPEEAIEAVQAQQGKIDKKVLSFRGLEKVAEAFGMSLREKK